MSKIPLYTLFLSLSLPATALAQTATCVDWSNITFPGGLTSNSCVAIHPDTVVNLDADVNLDTLLINGGVVLSGNRTVEVNLVLLNGLLEVGTEGAPYPDTADFDLTDDGDCTDAFLIQGCSTTAVAVPAGHSAWEPGMRHRLIHVGDGATLDLHGQPRENWKFLFDGPYDAGIDVVTVFDGDEWAEDDDVAIASTDFDQFQAYRTKIDSITPKAGTMMKHELTLEDPLNNMRWAGYVGDIKATLPNAFEHAEVGNLTHNIKVFSSTPSAALSGRTCYDVNPTKWPAARADAPIHDGAEIMFMAMTSTPTARIEYIEMYNAGKHDQLAQYPIHFHETGAMPGSYVRGTSIYDSSNRAIVLHGAQDILLEDNVAYNIVGHAYYLERSTRGGGDYSTKQNRLVQNLGMRVHCGAFDVDPSQLNSKGSAVFYWEDPRNVFHQNAAGGAPLAGFYYAATNGLEANDGVKMNQRHLCGDESLVYTTPGVDDYVPLDTSVNSDPTAPYGLDAYTHRGWDSLGSVRCYGTFKENISHSSTHGLYAEDHKNFLFRIYDFMTYKNKQYGLNNKNRGITEAIRLLSADNATGLWPATHAYHMWLTPRWWVTESRFIGESANVGTPAPGDFRSYPKGDETIPLYGVEVYEGHLHVSNSHFELFRRLDPAKGKSAAFGRHQRFPFYSNNTNNSVEALSFGPFTREVWFDLPAPQASGEASVMIWDLDSSFSFTNDFDWIVAKHDFIIPDAIGVWHAARQDIWVWNAFVIDNSMEEYGQLILHWCDSVTDKGPCNDNGSYSKYWDQPNDAWGTVEGLTLVDDTDGEALEAKHHFPQGTRSRLGSNVLSERSYTADFWADRNKLPGVVDYLAPGDMGTITAIDAHLRHAREGVEVTVNFPVPSAPTAVEIIHGEEVITSVGTATAAVGLPLTDPGTWFWDGTRMHVLLRANADMEQTTISARF